MPPKKWAQLRCEADIYSHWDICNRCAEHIAVHWASSWGEAEASLALIEDFEQFSRNRPTEKWVLRDPRDKCLNKECNID